MEGTQGKGGPVRGLTEWEALRRAHSLVQNMESEIQAIKQETEQKVLPVNFVLFEEMSDRARRALGDSRGDIVRVVELSKAILGVVRLYCRPEVTRRLERALMRYEELA